MYEYIIENDYADICVKYSINPEDGSIEDEKYYYLLETDNNLYLEDGITEVDITDVMNSMIEHRWIDFDKLQDDLIAFANSENLFREEQNRDVFGDIGKALRP